MSADVVNSDVVHYIC